MATLTTVNDKFSETDLATPLFELIASYNDHDNVTIDNGVVEQEEPFNPIFLREQPTQHFISPSNKNLTLVEQIDDFDDHPLMSSFTPMMFDDMVLDTTYFADEIKPLSDNVIIGLSSEKHLTVKNNDSSSDTQSFEKSVLGTDTKDEYIDTVMYLIKVLLISIPIGIICGYAFVYWLFQVILPSQYGG